jgi:hypothetical protein
VNGKTGDRDFERAVLHETAHYWQHQNLGYARSLNRLTIEQGGRMLSGVGQALYGIGVDCLEIGPFKVDFPVIYDPYTSLGALEWEARQIELTY